ncbi:MAG: glycosyltransferase family 4 protein [Rubrivivax sp.]|nr:glycosyltransferase family 4 protein [Rubrivivax sp.]
MKLLLINHYAGQPALGMEYRPYYLAREWVRSGHTVRILAASFSHVRARQPEPGDEIVDGIEYHWLPAPPYQGNGLGRVRNIMAFMSQVWAQAQALADGFQPDAVIASSTYPMDIWVARRVVQFVRAAGRPCKLVYEVHDLWPLSPIELSGMSPWHPFALICQSAEDAAYRHSDRVISMLPKVQQHMAGRGLDLSRLSIVPNGISPDDWKQTPPPLRQDLADALAEARVRKQVIVGYAGSMGLPNALDHLLDAIPRLAGAPIAVLMVGDGHERERLARRIADEALGAVRLLPPIPKAQVPAFLAAIDIAYIGWQRVPIYRFGIAPNKLMDYMMAGRTVLHAVEAGNDPVAEAGCGLTVPPEDPAAIAQGLQRLAALKPGERKAMGERGRQFVLRHHSYPVLAQRFLAALG